jgi:hypothetical protein
VVQQRGLLQTVQGGAWKILWKQFRGRIFSCVWPFYERAVSDLDPKRSIHRPVQVAHRLFIEGSHTTKNMASAFVDLWMFAISWSFCPKQGLSILV